jgi:hypothetical protein
MPKPRSTSTARFSPTALGQRGFSLRFQANSIIRLTDKVTGHFIGGGFNQALEEVNGKVAILMQEGQAQRLDEKIDATGRVRRVPGQRLKKSILHENNRDVSASGFTVGRPAWLDKSPAKLYWRRIEEGDTQTFDTVGGAFFTSNFAPGSFSVANPGMAQMGTRGGSGGAMRMPQRQALAPRILNVGPFPEYAFSLGGTAVYRRTNMGALYQTALAARGIPMDRVKR